MILLFGPSVLAPFSGLSPDKFFYLIFTNAFTIFWVLIVPILLFRVKQGREMFKGMFDDKDSFVGVRAASLILMFNLLALAIYLAPHPFFGANNNFEILTPITGINTGIALIACTLPMILFGTFMLVLQYNRAPRLWKIPVMLAPAVLAGWLCYAVLADKFRWNPGFWSLIGLTAVNMLLCFLWLQLASRKLKDNFWHYFTVGSALCIQIALIAQFIKVLPMDFKNGGNFALYDIGYLLLFGFLLLNIGLMAWFKNLQPVSPMFALLSIIAFFLLIGDLVYASIALHVDQFAWYSWTAIIGGILCFIWFVFFKKSGIHDINTVKDPFQSDPRIDLDTYFDAWWKTNIEPTIAASSPKSDIPVYLIAAQGGGSRAGFWVSEFLNKMNLETGDKFQKHLFAITSASGGSSGAAMTIALWKYFQENVMPPARKRAICENFAAAIYHRNYLTSAFIEVFICEVYKRFKHIFTKKETNRNYRLQQDEALAFAAAIKNGWQLSTDPSAQASSGFFAEIKTRLKMLIEKCKEDALTIHDKIKIPNYPFRPYMSYWYDEKASVDARLPLFFPISCIVQSGKSAYSSPIKMELPVFIDAVDIIDRVQNKYDNKTIALVTSSNLSQLFPAVNAHTHIPGTGNFIDGGLFENMGLSLMVPLAEKLHEKIQAIPDVSLRSRIKLKLIFCVNNYLKAQDPLHVKPVKNTWQMSGLFRAAAIGSIEGKSLWWQANCRSVLKNTVDIVEVVLQYPDNPAEESKRVPLGRWLSNASVETMKSKMADHFQSQTAVQAEVRRMQQLG